METTLSTKGQIVVPREIRQKLGLGPGAKLSTRIVDGAILLTPVERKPTSRRLVRDRATGLMVTGKSPGGRVVTSDTVRAILADFP